ncbi:MAG: dual specificity protein phosphatase family protein [Verrucomicrobia bacterium]|nr:dual specificity protein phosphatase family protein [Verrucomicrobiota bacterium]
MKAIRPWLCVGKYRDTLDQDYLRGAEIGVMLQLVETPRTPGIEALYLPIEDGQPIPPEIPERGVRFTLAGKNEGRRVMIVCGAGLSRSVSFAIAAIKESEGRTLVEAFQEVRTHHPEALPHPVLWKSLCERYRENVPYLTALSSLRR